MSRSTLAAVYNGDELCQFFVDKDKNLAILHGHPEVTENFTGPIKIQLDERFIRPDEGTQITAVSFQRYDEEDKKNIVEIRLYYVKEDYLEEIKWNSKQATLAKGWSKGSLKNNFRPMPGSGIDARYVDSKKRVYLHYKEADGDHGFRCGYQDDVTKPWKLVWLTAK